MSDNDERQKMTEETPPQSEPPEMEDLPGDFYIENGFLVFTAQYHLRRGFCCSSGCRHCPYK